MIEASKVKANAVSSRHSFIVQFFRRGAVEANDTKPPMTAMRVRRSPTGMRDPAGTYESHSPEYTLTVASKVCFTVSDALFSSAVRAARSAGVSACATASATASGLVKMLGRVSPGASVVVVVSKVSGGVVVRGVTLVDVTGGNVGVVVDVWGGVVACGRGGKVVRVVVTLTVVVVTS